MEIIDNRNNDFAYIESIDPGEIFEINTEIFIMADDDARYQGVNLRDGSIEFFDSNDQARRCNGVLSIQK